ncbi:MAG TPA: serine/threonine-protein kinase [Polyangiaceae bacterium]
MEKPKQASIVAQESQIDARNRGSSVAVPVPAYRAKSTASLPRVTALKEPIVGDVIDRRYALRREIDRGGIGAVFEAYHLLTTRAVAIKVLVNDHALNPESQARLLREAKALTLARHPNVVAVLDAGTTDAGVPYLVMELIEGRTLSGILASRRKLSIPDTLQIGVQLCEAMGSVHDRGIVHRDIKPSNLFLARNEIGEETIKLFDFGVAGLRNEIVAMQAAKLTRQGALLGTPEYMAPEQLLAKPADPRADIYSIGVTLYECLTGGVPFEGSFGEILLKASTESVPALTGRCADVSPALAAVIDRALAKDPADRYADARAFARALQETTDQPFGQISLLGIRRGRPPPLPPEARAPRPAPAVGGPAAAVPRRRYARAPYVTPVRIVQTDGITVDGHSEDVSEGGMLVLTRQLCSNEQSVTIRFALPGTGRIINLNATARWVRTARGTGAAGLEFLDMPDDIRDSIRDYVGMMGGRI